MSKSIFNKALFLLLAFILSYSNAVKRKSQQNSESLDTMYLQTDSEMGTEQQTQALNQQQLGVRIALKRRQKYLYDYFFPKNMRDHIEQRKTKNSNSTSHAQVQHNHKNQCELNQNGEQGSGGLALHMNNHMDFSYIADIYVGNNPPQKIRALFDTGSANTWILNKQVQAHDLHFSYDQKLSSTAQVTRQKAYISFGSGSLSGHFYVDDFRIGGCEFCQSSSQILIKNQKFGNVEKEDSIFRENFDAIVGLAYPNFAEKGVTPVMDNMIQQKLLQDNLFAFYLTSKMDEEMDGLDSELTFGYYDKSKYTGDMVWHPVLHKLMFGIELNDIKINGKSLHLCDTVGQPVCLITVDSGTSEMTMPSWALKKAIGRMPLKNNPTKCANQADIGDLTFVINGFEYTLPNDDWVEKSMDFEQFTSQAQKTSAAQVGPMAPEDEFLTLLNDNKHEKDENVQTQADSSKESCTSVMSGLDLGNKNTFIVGDIFMRKFYTVFDRDNDRVGIALAITADQIKEQNKQKMSKANQKLKTNPIKATAPKQPENHPAGTPFVEPGKEAKPAQPSEKTSNQTKKPKSVETETKSPIPDKPVSVPPPTPKNK